MSHLISTPAQSLHSINFSNQMLCHISPQCAKSHTSSLFNLEEGPFTYTMDYFFFYMHFYIDGNGNKHIQHTLYKARTSVISRNQIQCMQYLIFYVYSNLMTQPPRRFPVNNGNNLVYPIILYVYFRCSHQSHA